MPVSLEVYHAGYDANKSPMRNAYMTYLVTPFTYMAIISGVMCYDRECLSCLLHHLIAFDRAGIWTIAAASGQTTC